MFEKEEIINLRNAKMLFIEHFFEMTEADALFNTLIETASWQQGEVTMYGKKSCPVLYILAIISSKKTFTKGKVMYGIQHVGLP